MNCNLEHNYDLNIYISITNSIRLKIAFFNVIGGEEVILNPVLCKSTNFYTSHITISPS